MSSESQHKYEYDTDLEGNSTGAHIVRLIGNNKRVLELGAGPGSITKHLKNICNCNIVAIENDEKAIDKLTIYCEKIYNIDLNNKSWPKALDDEEKFDVVLAADVLEHLYDPWAVLEAMKNLLTDDGFLIISLPHVGHNAVLASILDSDFEYRDCGLLDKTHIRFFAMNNIKAMFESAELRVDDAQFVIARPEVTELSYHWRKLTKTLRRALLSNKYGMVYQVVVKTLSKNNSINGIDLTVLRDDVKKIIWINKIKSLTDIYLPSPLVKLLRKFVNKLKKWK